MLKPTVTCLSKLRKGCKAQEKWTSAVCLEGVSAIQILSWKSMENGEKGETLAAELEDSQLRATRACNPK